MFECKDIVIDKLISDGMSVEEIQNYIKHRLVFSKEEVVENFNYIIEKFKLREKNCDVKITDFILENYKNYQMFYDLYHASAKVISEMTRRILIELGIENTKLSEQEFEYSGGEMPIYKDIAKALNLKYWSEDGEIRKKSYRKYTDVMNLDEYIKEYIFLKDVD